MRLLRREQRDKLGASIMLKHRWALAFAWLLQVCVFPAFGRNPWLVDVWDTEKGLPQNSVIALAQSRAGYLWLGTLNGLARFDGIHFTTFNESNTRGLDSGRIVHLFADRQDVLWLGTETAGAAMIRDGELRGLDIGRGSRGTRLAAACEDADGAVWLYTADGQLARHLNGQVHVWRLGGERPSDSRMLAAQPGGGLWAGTDWGIYDIRQATNSIARELPVRRSLPAGKLDYLLAARQGGFWRLADGRVQRWTAEKLERDFGPYPWRGERVSAACEDREGNLIVGTLGAGVFWFDASGKAANISTNDGLSNNYILSLLVDREGSLWVGTDGGGLNRVKRPLFAVPAATRGALVQSVCEDGAGGLWLVQAGGVSLLKNGEFRPYELTNELFNVFASVVFVDRAQNVWAGTRNGGLFQLRTNRFEPVQGGATMGRNISAIHEDRAGNLWVGTQDGLMRRDGRDWRMFTTNDGLSANVVRAIADDGDGNLWVGTDGGGLNRWRDGHWTVFRKPDGLPSDSLTALLVDADNVLWAGTDGGGLARFARGKWSVCTQREGLTSDSVGFLLEDGQHQLWIGSYAGLLRVPKQSLNDLADGLTNTIAGRRYGKADGLPTTECAQGAQPAACRARDGRLWFPTIKGLAAVLPAQLQPNTNPPPVLIESVLVENQQLETNSLRSAPWEGITIPARRERLEIHFTSLNLSAPDRARFKYRLTGHETGWVDAGDSRVARYPKLPPGEYVFEVTAGNEDGFWNPQGVRLAVTVLPPFWQTWWFLTAGGIGLLLAIIGVVHYFSTQKLQRQLAALRQKEALEKERSRIARDLHDQLGANLTQVALLGEFVESDKQLPAEVEIHARQISQTARDTTRALDEIVWAANPANDTLEGLINYIGKHAQDFLTAAGLRYRLDVPPNPPPATLAPEIRHNVFLAFKEALNNVVKHARATEARIRLRVADDRFTLEVEDDGCGAGDLESEHARSRNGLRNLRQRMADIRGAFSIGPGPDGGTLVRLTVPLQKV